MMWVLVLQVCRRGRLPLVTHVTGPGLWELCGGLWTGQSQGLTQHDGTLAWMQSSDDGAHHLRQTPAARMPPVLVSSLSQRERLSPWHHRSLHQAALEAEPEQLREELPSFEALLKTEQLRVSGKLAGWDSATKQHVKELLQGLRTSGSAKDKARAMFVNTELWPRAVSSFSRFIARAITPALQRELWRHKRYSEDTETLLMEYFRQYVAHVYAEETAAYRQLVVSVDMMQPHTWYPFARALDRKVIYHAGPTNSGKTYNALEALKRAPTGVYCGPLRLLAMEVYDRLNMEGVRCNLLTGQEKRLMPGAQHTACTVEMVNFSKRLDVAVIDEIQLTGDEQRGWAWTRALLGLPANEIHICGDMSAVDLVKSICRTTGEELTLETYERFTPLTLEQDSMKEGYHKVQPGDCIVTFSRKRIYEIKAEIEEATGQTTAVVYGALPAETRRQQARLFNDPSNKFNILVASDAVGMGLNLNIRRIIFDTVYKKMGGDVEGLQLIPVSLAKQIAGRAGRRSSAYPEGIVTARNPRDIPFLQEVLDLPNHALVTPQAGLFPEYEQIELVAGKLPSATFAEVIAHFTESALLDEDYFFSKQEGMVTLARILDKVPGLSLEERYAFCSAPVNIRVPACMAMLLEFATRFSRGNPVDLNMPVPSRPPVTAMELHNLELAHQVVSLWLWLSYRFEEGAFPGRDSVMHTQQRLLECMDQGLLALSRRTMRGARRQFAMQAGQRRSSSNTGVASAMGEEDPLQFINASVRKFIRKSERPLYMPLH